MKNRVELLVPKENYVVTFRSDFDSGNMSKVQLGINNSFIIYPQYDCFQQGVQNHIGWFYFAVKGIPLLKKHKFVVKKLYQLSGQVKNYFKPVYKYEGGQWNRIELSICFTKEDDTQLHFQFISEKKAQIFFAYSYPYSYQQCEQMLRRTYLEHRHSKVIYYHDQTIIKSPEGRPLHLLTISSHEEKLNEKEPLIDQHLFGGNNKHRSHKFSQQKKVAIITARVHPAETPASHTLNGILNFITSKDVRAHLLRKHFVFKIIPMLNPDGVFNGHYRMDTLNQNLNRYYANPDVFKQPSAFAVRQLGQYYQHEGTLFFYMDLHAHHQKKGSFIYGNNYEKIIDQVQTQLYPKILSMNSIDFEYNNSSFAKKEMNSKDKKDILSKEGCGRVIFSKDLGQIYSYTLEVGYTMSSYFNQLQPIHNAHRKYEKYGIIHQQIQNIKSTFYSNKKNLYFSLKSYENLGKSTLISLLDLSNNNMFSRIIPNSTLEGVRKQIHCQITKAEPDLKIYATRVQHYQHRMLKVKQQKQKQKSSVLPKSKSSFKNIIHPKNFQMKAIEGKMRYLSLAKNRFTK